MGEKEKMVWSPVWLNVLQTIVWLPFKSHAQSSFDKNVLLSNPYSKMVGFCFGLAIPTLDWYTTLALAALESKLQPRKPVHFLLLTPTT